MKPSQFLYSESIKEQKAQKANATKSIGELKPIPKSANPPKDQNSSMIYSLVNLPVKEGQNDTVIFPQSLISQSLNVRPEVVVGKNTEIARSLKKLKPLESLDSALEPAKPGTQRATGGEQLSGPKLQTYLKSLNQLTNGLFKKTQTQLLFGSIEPKISHNTVLCVVRIQKLKFFNEYNPKNDKIPPLFCWEAIYRKKSLMKTTPKEFDAAQQDLLDFLYTRNNYEPAEILLWKIKNNDEKYVGQFDITGEDFQNLKEVLDFKQKIICEKFLEKEMFKSMKQTKSYIGNVQFQLIQLGHEKIPLDKHSGIPGSPRTEEEKSRHKIIDAAMSGQEYRWHIDENEKIVIEKIDEITKEIVAEITIEAVQDECGQIYILFETRYENPDDFGRSRVVQRRFKKDRADANIILLKELDKNGYFTEVQSMLRDVSRKRSANRKVFEAAILDIGCTANELFLTQLDDYGECLMDYLLNMDDLPAVLEAMQEIKFAGEDESNLESVSNNLFQNIGQHLRKNLNLKAIIQFIKALEAKPETGVLIYNYSYATENILSETPPFLQNFDPKNYEHVMVLGKLNKMIDKFKIQTKFTKALKKAQVEAKKEIYFEIPCFPKKKNLDDKSDSLQLKGLGQNIMHEIVRRQKWNKSHTIFEQYPEWFFVADEQGMTPFDRMLETAPFDVIKQLIAAYPDQLDNIFSKYNPDENLYESRIPKQEKNEDKPEGQEEGGEGGEGAEQKKKDEQPDEDKLFEQRKEKEKARNAFSTYRNQKEYRKNLLHNLIFNPNGNTSQAELLDAIRSVEILVNKSNENNFEILKTQKLRAGDFIPLFLYLETLRSKCKKKFDRVQRELGTSLFICQMLTPITDEDEQNQGQEGSDGQDPPPAPKTTFKWDFQNQLIISQILAKLPEQIFGQFDDIFRFIKWIPQLEELKTIRFINLPFRPLIKHKQQQKLFTIVEQMMDELKAIQYDPTNLESDDNVKILYYFQLFIIMLLEIRNLRSQKLDSVASQIIQALRDLTLKFTELLVVDMPKNILQSYYPLNIQYWDFNQKLRKAKDYEGVKINNLLQLLNFIKFNMLLIEIPVSNLDRIDIKLLAYALKDTADQDSLRDFLRLVLAKFPRDNLDVEGSVNEDDLLKKFELTVNPDLIESENGEKYQTLLSNSQVEQLLQSKKAMAILKFAIYNDRFSQNVHNTIIRSFQTRKSVGVTQQQLALWLRQNFDKIVQPIKNRYFDYFRTSFSLQQIHTLIDLEYPTTNRQYHNLGKIYPYIQAQGKNWASILEVRKFAAAIKDNISYISLEQILRQIAINGQYEKLEIILPFLKDAQTIRQSIHLVSAIADLQIFNFKQYFDQGQLKKKNPHIKDDEVELADENDDDKPDDGGDGAQLVSENQEQQQKKQTKKEKQDKQTKQESTSGDQYLDILYEFRVRCYDPTVYFFKTSIKEKKEKYKFDSPKFPEVLDQIRTPISVQSQLEEMSPAFQIEMDDFIKSSWPKFGKISFKKFENILEKDVLIFRYLKNWKQSLGRQNIRSVFTQYEQGSGQQSYKKVLNLLIKQYQRYGMPLCDQPIEYERTLAVLMTYGMLNMEQIIFQVASSKFPEQQRTNILTNLIRKIIHPVDQPLAKYYQQKNAISYIQNVNRIIKMMNLKSLDETMVEQFKDCVLNPLKKALMPINTERGILIFKLASEIFQRLEQQDLKTLFIDHVQDISRFIKKQVKEKSLLQIANRYVPDENQSTVKTVKPSYKDVILLFKKKKLEEALEYDIVNYFKSFTDAQCEEIVTELFKLPYDKSYKDELLNKFNEKLFEGLIFFRRYKTYNRLINDILFKKILKENKEQFIAIFKKHLINQELAMKQNNENEPKPEQEGEDADQAPVQQKEEPQQEGSGINIPEQASQFCFYEYFDTLHKYKLRCKDIQPNNCQRFSMLDNPTLIQLSIQFEQQGQNYISNCLKLLKFLRENNPEQRFNESQIMLAFVNESSKNLDSKSMKFIKLILEVQDRKIPFYMNSVLVSQQQKHKPKLNNQDDIFKLKVAGIEKGIKFCIASDFVNTEENYNITNDDIRKTQAQRLKFTLDQYTENIKQNDKIKVGYQILNDQELNNILKQLIHPFKQPEFLIDKLQFSEEFTKYSCNNKLFQYFLINFPTFWYDDKFKKESLTNNAWFQDFELGLIQFKSTLIFEPQNIEKVLELYFLSIQQYSKKEEGEAEEANEKQEDQQEESEWEEYEIEVTDDEADVDGDLNEAPVEDNANDAKEPKDDQQDQDGNVKLQAVDEAPKVDQAEDQAEPKADRQTDRKKADSKQQQSPLQQQQPKVKKTKKITQKRKKQKEQQEKKFVESNNSIRKLLQESCSNQVFFQTFLQLLLLATTNDDLFRLIQKYLIQYGVLSPLSAPEEFDPVRKARLLKDGFKEPFNMKFVEEQEARGKELKTQSIEDIKHIKDILTNNQKKRRDEQSEVYQALIQSVLQCEYEDYQSYVDHLFDNPAYRLLQKNKKQAATHPLDQDQKFQIELRQHFAQTENLQLSQDFIQKFFENSKTQTDSKVLTTTDKWIHVICLLNYCKQIQKQIKQFEKDVNDYQDTINKEKPKVDTFDQYQKEVKHLVKIDSSYNYKFKVSNKMEPVIYEYKKDVIQNTIDDPNQFDIELRYNFKFELTFNIKQGTLRYNPFPVAQLQQKYIEEVVKTFDLVEFDEYNSHIEEIIQVKKQYAPQLSEFDDIDFNQLRVKLTRENYKDYMNLHYMKNFYLNDVIQQIKDDIGIETLEKVLNGIVETESSDGMNQIMINDKQWYLYSSRIRPDIKLKYQDKQYPVPYSNYQPRQRNTSYKQSLQSDLAFPELYPLVILQVYLYIPDILTEEQFNLKYDPLSIIQQACFDLNSYSQALDDIITSPPSENLLQYFENKTTAPQIVYWPLIQSKHKKINLYEQFTPFKQAHPITIINYLFQKLQFQIDHEIQFTYNVLSLTEILLFKITRIIQQTTGKRCQLQTAISILQDWPLLRKIIVRIADILMENDLNKFKFYYVEVSEIHQNSVFQLKSNKLEGLDQIFRFGQTQFFVHSNVLVIRLNLAVVSENGNAIVGQQKNIKLRQYEGTHQIFKQDKEIKDYIGFIVTLEDMLKQIFTKK